MKVFNVGVVGIGDISDVYISNLKTYDIGKVLACAGRDLKARQVRPARDSRAYASPAELFADPEIDIVLNLTTPDVHAELNLTALEAGKHVLHAEKAVAPVIVLRASPSRRYLVDRHRHLS